MEYSRPVRSLTTRAAMNSGFPRGVSKSQSAVNARLDSLDFDCVFDRSRGEIESEEFNRWRAESVKTLREEHPALSYAWAAKHIAIYLKVTCYLAGFGRDGLKDVMHPPFDGPLLAAVRNQPLSKIRRELPLRKIDEECYWEIISEMRQRSHELGCTLFEVEQLWSPPST